MTSKRRDFAALDGWAGRAPALAALLAAAALAGCDDTGAPDGDGDADADATADAEADADADPPPVGPEDCPRNSAWPCTCDRAGACEDGSPCVSLPFVSSGLGVCVAPCIAGAPPGAACPEEDFGAPGWCQIRQSATGEPTHCLLVCVSSEVCPSDQSCVDPRISGVPGYCLPE